jgi:hypothetical protein
MLPGALEVAHLDAVGVRRWHGIRILGAFNIVLEDVVGAVCFVCGSREAGAYDDWEADECDHEDDWGHGAQWLWECWYVKFVLWSA